VAVVVLIAGLSIKWLLPSIQDDDAAEKLPDRLKTIIVPTKAPTNSAELAVLPATEGHNSETQQNRVSQPKPENVKPDTANASVVSLPETETNSKLDKAVQHKESLPLKSIYLDNGTKVQTIIPVESTVEDKPKVEVSTVVNQVPSQNLPQISVQAANTPSISIPTASKVEKPAVESNQAWIMAQPADNFTLQVMVLSNKDAANRFLKKYADYNDNLKYYTIGRDNLEKYVLIYGSFKTANEALHSKAMLPDEFKQAIEKGFRTVQKESRR
jgi:DamX protein